MSSIAIKRINNTDVMTKKFNDVHIGEIFEDKADEDLYIKIDNERAANLRDGEVYVYNEDDLVNMCEIEINYRRIIQY